MRRIQWRILCGMLSIVLFFPAWASDAVFTPAQKARIDVLIGQYIKDHPKMIIKSIVAHRQAELAKRHAKVRETIKAEISSLANPDFPTYWGSKKPKIMVIEFTDYQCAHCRDMADVVRDVVGKQADVRIVVRELPVLGHHSLLAAKVAMLASEQGHYASVHHHLMDAALPLNERSIMDIAKAHGMRPDVVSKQLKDKRLNDAIAVNFHLAKQLKLMGTPAFIVSDAEGKHFYFVPGVISKADFQALIKKIIASDD